MFLKLKSRSGTHFEVMGFENLTEFLVTGLDGLASVVVTKPARQVGNDVTIAEVK